MSQSATGLLKQLQDHRFRLFTTSDVMTLTGMKPPAATQALRRLAAQGLLSPIKRGLWANRMIQDLDPMETISHLTAPWPSYVSLYSALSLHRIIEEVPQAIYAVSAARARRYHTPIGDYRIHHLPQRLIWGFQIEHHGRASFPMADPEKAFLDLAYLGLIPRSPLGMPYQRDKRWKLDFRKLAAYAKRFRFPPLLNYLKTLAQTA